MVSNEMIERAKQRWAKLTDQDLQFINGNVEALIGRIQKVYGYSKEKAVSEYESFRKTLTQGRAQSPEPKANQASNTWDH